MSVPIPSRHVITAVVTSLMRRVGRDDRSIKSVTIVTDTDLRTRGGGDGTAVGRTSGGGRRPPMIFTP